MYKNNFDFLRLIFSLLVILSHSYILSGGKGDFLHEYTHHQLLFSDVGLAGFFSISGFLIFQSLEKSKSVFHYLKKRVSRIYPGFLVAIVLCMMVGFIVSGLDGKTYFANNDPWKYLYKKVFLFTDMHHRIKGVFENNLYPGIVNASLWTIPYEFLFYLLLTPLFFIKNKPILISSILAAVIIILTFINFHLPGYRIPQTLLVYFLIPFKSIRIGYFIRFLLFFVTGSLLARFKELIIRYRQVLFITALGLAVACVYFNIILYTQYFILPIAIISFGQMNTRFVAGLSQKIGDLSYGTYLYAFLIQQTLMFYFPLKHWQLTLITIPIALLFGLLSWNLVEKRFLRFKRKSVV
ncbi:MAG: Acyltransferase family protein [Segetibacter sp.]|nr:Acyltransferase family protein [Segetibacter sp.]